METNSESEKDQATGTAASQPEPVSALEQPAARDRDLLNEVRSQLSSRIGQSHLMSRMKALMHRLEPSVDKMRRVVLLNLKDPEDDMRWQVIHNTPDKYEIISEKETISNRGEYFVRLVYYELGSDQPIAKNSRKAIVSDEDVADVLGMSSLSEQLFDEL